MSGNRLQRVLLTGDTAGGVWTFCTELAAGLIRSGVQVHFASLGPSVSKAQMETAKSIEGLTWLHRPGKLEWMDEPWADVDAGGVWLQAAVREFRPDLIHLNTLSYGDIDFATPSIQTYHSCVCSWWSAVKQAPLPAGWARYHSQVNASLRGASVVTAPSAAALADVFRHYDVPTQKGVAVHNGVDSAAFKPMDKEPFVLSAGRLWDEGKNVRALAEIASELPWPVYLAGNAAGPTGTGTQFENCHLLGELSRKDLSVWYGRAGIYALPARYEPFGLSCLEAALSGCALVLGDMASLREIWADSAVFVDPNDRPALRREIQVLISNPERRETMAKRAMQRASTYSVQRMTEGYLKAYRSALALRNRSGMCVS